MAIKVEKKYANDISESPKPSNKETYLKLSDNKVAPMLSIMVKISMK